MVFDTATNPDVTPLIKNDLFKSHKSLVSGILISKAGSILCSTPVSLHSNLVSNNPHQNLSPEDIPTG